MKKNNSGAVLTLSMIAAVGLLMTPAVIQKIEGKKAPTFKEDGKRIWCKMQNKGNTYCDIVYGR